MSTGVLVENSLLESATKIYNVVFSLTLPLPLSVSFNLFLLYTHTQNNKNFLFLLFVKSSIIKASQDEITFKLYDDFFLFLSYGPLKDFHRLFSSF